MFISNSSGFLARFLTRFLARFLTRVFGIRKYSVQFYRDRKHSVQLYGDRKYSVKLYRDNEKQTKNNKNELEMSRIRNELWVLTPLRGSCQGLGSQVFRLQILPKSSRNSSNASRHQLSHVENIAKHNQKQVFWVV